MLEQGTVQVSFLDQLGDTELVDNSVEEAVTQPDQVFEDEDAYNRYQAYKNLYGHIYNCFQQAQDDRQVRENIDLTSWHNYRGEYFGQALRDLQDAKSRDPASSDIFVKITKTKVLAAYGQLLEILEGDNRFPITVEETKVPDGVPEKVFVESQPSSYKEDQIIDPYGYPGDGKEIEKGATKTSLLERALRDTKDFLSGKTIKEGSSPDRTQIPELKPAQMAAKQMDKMIQDQLQESNSLKHLSDCAFECTLFGTGIIKGPLTTRVELPNWVYDEELEKMVYTPEYRLSPKITNVSKWNFYPDPTARTIDDCEFIIERHLLNKPELRKLADQPGFDASAVLAVLEQSPQYEREEWENELQDDSQEDGSSRYQVLEFWGYIDKELAQVLNLDVSDVNKNHVMINAWVCKNEVLKVTLNPLIPRAFPYHPVQFEKHGYQIWGVGVAENMDDVQKLMNGHMRMAIDNLRLAGNAIFEVDTNILAPNQDFQMSPGKVFYKQDGAPGQAIHSIDFQNTAPQHIQMFDKVRQLADEKTGIPSYSHGQTGIAGTTRTASGMSMLMGAATLSTKTILNNWDRMLERLGQMMFAWNMQFNDELPEVMRGVTMGDLMIKASGTASFMQREVRSQRLLQLLQVGAQDPMLNREWAMKEFAKSMDFDPNDAVNDPQTALLYAQLLQMGQQNAQAQTGQGPISETPSAGGTPGGGGASAAVGGTNPADPTGSGGGAIGTGTAPGPGESGFSINPQGT